MSLAEAYAHCERLAKLQARDRWLGSLFAPAEARPHLHALIAFELEMGRLREAVRDPRAGEIRLVWWREALTGARAEEAQGNPVAAATLDTLQRVKPSPHLIENAIAGRQADLYDDPFPAVGDLESYLGETRSGLIQIAAIVLAGERQAGSAEASGLAGVALGLIDLLCGLSGARPLLFVPADVLSRRDVSVDVLRAREASPGMAAALGEMTTLARRRLAEAEAAVSTLPRALKPAYAGLATAPLWLNAIERERRLFDCAPDVAAWRRQWALWRWMRR